MAKTLQTSFQNTPGFCPDCGAILPLLGARGGVKCYTCHREYGPEVFGSMEQHFVVNFNTVNTYQKHLQENSDIADGPVVERRCPKCNNNQMSYTTLQLRSADEGQTIFFTCTKCKFKETENS